MVELLIERDRQARGHRVQHGLAAGLGELAQRLHLDPVEADGAKGHRQEAGPVDEWFGN